MLEIKQTVVVYDQDRDTHAGVVLVKVDSTVKEPFVFLPDQHLTLTKDGIDQLLVALQSAKELIGQDFIVHHDGSIAVTHDDGDKLVDTNYDNLADYQIGRISVQD